MQKFRRGIPEKSSVYICKNSLMKEAVKVTPGWDMVAEKGCTVSKVSAVINSKSMAAAALLYGSHQQTGDSGHQLQ